jgi:hypothetical protein
MELSDEKVLESLLRIWEEEQLASNVIHPVSAAVPEPVVYEAPLVYEAPRHKSFRRHCKCGVCVKCKENARWERIFQAKFADPDYYRPRAVPHVSPLSDE